MSGPPRVRSDNIATEMEARSVLGPAGNKVPTKPAPKSTSRSNKPVRVKTKIKLKNLYVHKRNR